MTEEKQVVGTRVPQSHESSIEGLKLFCEKEVNCKNQKQRMYFVDDADSFELISLEPWEELVGRLYGFDDQFIYVCSYKIFYSRLTRNQVQLLDKNINKKISILQTTNKDFRIIAQSTDFSLLNLVTAATTVYRGNIINGW